MNNNRINPGEENNEQLVKNNERNNSYKLFLYIATTIVALAGVYVAWLYVSSSKDWGFEIEWKFWKSTILWPILSVIGFFLQFIDWQHTSFDEGWVIKDSLGRERFVKNNDILSFLWGNCLFPLIAHFFLIPCAYGAVLYYLIMLPVALLNSLIPYLAAVFCVVTIVYFYVGSRHYEKKSKTKSFILLIVTLAFALGLLWLLYLPTKDDFTFGKSKISSEIQYNSSDNYGSSYYEESNYENDGEYIVEEETSEQLETTESESSEDEEKIDDNQNIQIEETNSESVAEETPVETVDQEPEVQQNERKRPATQVLQSNLLSARLGNVAYNNGKVEVTIVIRTSMVRRQFKITSSSARDDNNQNVSVSNVEISGISKESGRDYYIITNNDTAYLTVTIPKMPTEGCLSFVRVDMSLSGTSQWVTIKNLSW